MKTVKQKSGYALITVMFIMGVFAVIVAMLMRISQQRIHETKRLTNKIKALAYAEAGVDHAYAILSNDYDQRDNPSAFGLTESENDGTAGIMSTKSASSTRATSSAGVTSQYGDGTFTLMLTPVTNRAVIVTSYGACENSSAVTEVLIEDKGTPPSSTSTNGIDPEPFNYAILCGGYLKFRGCGTIASPGGKALFHANGTMDNRGNTHADIDLSSSVKITSGNVTFGGDITAPRFGLHKKADVLGTITKKTVPPVTIPDIDLTPYYNWALDHGEVHNGFTTTTDINPNGGILWVEGDVHISSHAVVNGSIFCTGSMHMSGYVDVNPTICAFGLVARDGDIHITSGGTINGLIYAKTGNMQHTANGEVRGQIIINGNIDKAGNSDIMTDFIPNIPTPPGGGYTPGDPRPEITAWQK